MQTWHGESNFFLVPQLSIDEIQFWKVFRVADYRLERTQWWVQPGSSKLLISGHHTLIHQAQRIKYQPAALHQFRWHANQLPAWKRNKAPFSVRECLCSNSQVETWLFWTKEMPTAWKDTCKSTEPVDSYREAYATKLWSSAGMSYHFMIFKLRLWPLNKSISCKIKPKYFGGPVCIQLCTNDLCRRRLKASILGPIRNVRCTSEQSLPGRLGWWYQRFYEIQRAQNLETVRAPQPGRLAVEVHELARPWKNKQNERYKCGSK